jgi:hypothetical protein
MTYLERLRALKSQKGHPPAPSKPSKRGPVVEAAGDTTRNRGFEGFEGGVGTPFSEITHPLQRVLSALEARCPMRPHPSYSRLSRYDETGLIWLLCGREVLALTEATAAIQNPTADITVYRRFDKPALGPARRQPLDDSSDPYPTSE